MRIVFVVCLLLSQTSFAQTLNQLVKAGDTKFAEGDYYAASLYYKDALNKNLDNVDMNFKFAEASRMFNDYAYAASAYKNVVKLDKANQYPLAAFWAAEMLRSTCDCKTEEAITYLKKFRNRYHKKDYYAAKATQEMEACAWVLEHKKAVDSIKIEHLGKEVNTPNSEFNAVHVFPDKLQFSSLRNISSDKKNEKYLVRIYNQQPNPETIYMPNGASAELNVGNAAYSPDVKKLFFTECEQKDKTATRCDIYVSRYDNYKWMPAEKLSSNINDARATNTHPAVGYDQAGNEVLFFASDREGGQGKMDIWVSKLNSDGTYATAINAGDKINTQGNEITPFYDANNKQLFFSSDWHYGFGAYDIFESKGEYSTWSKPQNMLQPVNTAQNDLYYSMATDNSKAYITSNRVGSYYIEAETCCNDIYAYNTGKKIEIKRVDTTAVVIKTDTPSITATSKPAEPIASITTPEPAPVAHTRTPARTTSVEEKLTQIRKVLPVLYFHNDEPECCNLRDTTRLNYKQTYEAYTVRLNEYETQYAKGLKGDENAKAKRDVDDLFANKVDKGFYDLISFSAQMLDLLQGGNKIEITIKGYCSPLNFNEYNIKLGYRRVASLRNYFYHYRDGILLPYITNGTLVLKNVSFGEETAAKNISDDRLDKKNSVYSPAAALERRVEVISIDVGK